MWNQRIFWAFLPHSLMDFLVLERSSRQSCNHTGFQQFYSCASNCPITPDDPIGLHSYDALDCQCNLLLLLSTHNAPYQGLIPMENLTGNTAEVQRSKSEGTLETDMPNTGYLEKSAPLIHCLWPLLFITHTHADLKYSTNVRFLQLYCFYK